MKTLQEMPAPCTEKEVQGFLGRLNYIARYISHLIAICDPIFKLLKKDQVVKWNDDCQIILYPKIFPHVFQDFPLA